jgi:imidazolonepropionase-like amidohydrolase
LTLFTTTLAALLAGTLVTQSAQVPAPKQSQPIAILNATVHTVAREGPQTIDRGYVLFTDGAITAVGAGDPPALPADVRTYDARGLHVSPGFMASMTQLGLVEILSVESTDDRAEFGSIHPEAVAATAINPDSDLLPVARAAGILLSMTAPTGGLISGRPSVLRLDGWTSEQLTVDREVGVVVNWPLTEPVFAWWTRKPADEQAKSIKKDLESIDRFFTDAAAYLNRVDAFAETPRDQRFEAPSDQRFEAMRWALKPAPGARRDPVFITCGSASQIEAAVAWSLRRGVTPVIVGGRGVEASIPLLKRHDIGVILAGTYRLPGSSDASYDEPYALPAKLQAAGIRFAISTADEPAHERGLPHAAGIAAAFGLTPEQALTAITRSPAELYGIDGTYGSIANGKSATLIVTTGDPLEITSDVVLAFIDGRTIDLGSRQKRLHEKYTEKYRQLGTIK